MLRVESSSISKINEWRGCGKFSRVNPKGSSFRSSDSKPDALSSCATSASTVSMGQNDAEFLRHQLSTENRGRKYISGASDYQTCWWWLSSCFRPRPKSRIEGSHEIKIADGSVKRREKVSHADRDQPSAFGSVTETKH
jgi:hypothetical protein